MLTLIFFYLILPFILSVIVIKFLKKYGRDPVPREIHELYALDPIERRYYRVIRIEGGFGRPGTKLAKIGDFEKQDEAIDVAYRNKSRVESPDAASYLVLNEKGEILQQV